MGTCPPLEVMGGGYMPFIASITPSYALPIIPLPQAIERELAPVEGRLARLNELAKTVLTSNLAAAREVNGRQAEIADLWAKLKVCCVGVCLCVCVQVCMCVCVCACVCVCVCVCACACMWG